MFKCFFLKNTNKKNMSVFDPAAARSGRDGRVWGKDAMECARENAAVRAQGKTR